MAFSPRLNSYGIYNSKWWYSSGNPFYPTYGMPNCTCYCYGRWGELFNEFKNLPTGNAGTWYSRATNFNRGQIPALGAIACWYSPDGKYAGHVAVVEQILDSGDILTSNSGYYRPVASYPPDTKNYFWTETCYKSNGYRSSWEVNRGYQLAGFIYLDEEPTPTPTEWIKGNRFLELSEMQNNAYIIYSLLYSQWTLSAISGMLGNMVTESTINPGIWESLNPVVSNGFGLVQWTPSTNYTNWASEKGYESDDGNGQIEWINTETVKQGQWIPTSNYNISFDDFKTSTETPEWCASAFLRDFERPASFATEDTRRTDARMWYDYLKDLDPFNPTPNPQEKYKRLKVWQMIRYY